MLFRSCRSAFARSTCEINAFCGPPSYRRLGNTSRKFAAARSLRGSNPRAETLPRPLGTRNGRLRKKATLTERLRARHRLRKSSHAKYCCGRNGARSTSHNPTNNPTNNPTKRGREGENSISTPASTGLIGLRSPPIQIVRFCIRESI